MTMPLFDGSVVASDPPVAPVKVVRTFPFDKRTERGTWLVTVTHVGRPQVAIRCTCPAFKYSRWQECRHVKQVAQAERLFTVIGGCLVNYPPELVGVR